MNIKGCELTDRYDEMKREYENKYKTSIKKYEAFAKLKEIHKLLIEVSENEYTELYAEYLGMYNTDNNTNSDISDELLTNINKLYEEMSRKMKHYNEFKDLIKKLYYIRYTTIKHDTLKKESIKLYSKVLKDQMNIKDNEEVFNNVKEIVEVFDILSSIRNIKYLFFSYYYIYRREFGEVYVNLKSKLPDEKSYNEKYNEILNYIIQIKEKDPQNNELYYEKVKSYNEEIKVYIYISNINKQVVDRIYHKKIALLKLLENNSELEKRKEIENINPYDTKNIIIINEIIFKLNHKYHISYESINTSIQNVIKENEEYIKYYNKFSKNEELIKVEEYIKYSDVLPIVENTVKYISDDKEDENKDYIEGYHILRRMYFYNNDLLV